MKKLLATIVVAVCAAFTASAAKIDLSTVTANKTLANGDVAYGTLGANVKVSIAVGATVTISNAVINGVDNSNYNWAGITCNGNATIIVKGVNTVKGFYDVKPGIHVPWGSTLTILGDGRLTASSNGSGAGIGGGFDLDCGNIVISNATVTATGRDPSAGIGGGGFSACGSITIGGSATVTATGGAWAAGIGGGSQGSCGTVRIAGGTVTATATGSSTYASGIGCGDDGTCTRVEISNGITLVTATGGESGSPIYGSASDSISPDLVDTVSGNTRTLTGASFFDGDLATVTRNVAAQDGAVIHGTLSGNYKISIAAGATVMLANAAINGVNNSSCNWAGLTCNGDATIIVKGVNTVKGFYDGNPGIYVPQGSTLTILGDGRLTANNNGHAAGIGGGYNLACGNIVISNATVIATGRDTSAGIGGGGGSACGSITIGGSATVTATGGAWAAGIGGGSQGSCGTVRIAGGTVAATATGSSTYASGIGRGDDGTCTRVEISNGITRVTATGGESGGSPIYGSESDYISPDLENTVSGNTRTLKGVSLLDIDLATVTRDVTALDGAVIYGTLSGKYKVSIAAGATVTLRGGTILVDGVENDTSCKWAGINCLGDATIVLEGNNDVRGFHRDYPGIHVPQGSTLTIKGSGSLAASSNGFGTGIGGGYNIPCGSIDIQSGYIDAEGGSGAAAIGGGGGENASCGNIRIRAGVARVRADVVDEYGNPWPIGPGAYGNGGNVTVDPGTKSTQESLMGDILRRTITWGGNLSLITTDVTALSGTVITGTLNMPCKVSIADGATVTVFNAVINGYDSAENRYAGLTCLGSATINLKGGNTVRGFHHDYPGIYVPAGNLLTLQGTGILSAYSNGSGAGIGGGYGIDCGEVAIDGGTITAVGGYAAAGIGGGSGALCGMIRVNSEAVRVVATSGPNCANPIGKGTGGTGGAVSVDSTFIDRTAGSTRTIVNKRVNLALLDGDFIAENGMTLYGVLQGAYKISIADGATVTLGDVDINYCFNYSEGEWAGLTCLGDATLVLEGTYSNQLGIKGFGYGYPGIFVPRGKTLAIRGDGYLYVEGQDGAAGIGSGNNGDCGNIEINGGSIDANGGYNGAGIGSGDCGDCGDITINGGTILANGAGGGAGIGSGTGLTAGVYGHRNSIYINGGVVVATGGSYGGAGIGTGHEGHVMYDSTIQIRGGNVTANGGTNAAGIGCGEGGQCNEIDIGAGITTVIAHRGTGSGSKNIGGEWGGQPVAVNVAPELRDMETENERYIDTVAWDGDLGGLAAGWDYAVATNGATIHGTLAANALHKIGISSGATVTISNAIINGVDRSDCKWAGITCYGDATIILEGASRIRGFYASLPGIYVPPGCTLTIKGSGSLDAKSNGFAPGIGGASSLDCGNIRIEGGDIRATGGHYSPGIGSCVDRTCGWIDIEKTVLRVIAEHGSNCENNIGYGGGYGGGGGEVTVRPGLSDVTTWDGSRRTIQWDGDLGTLDFDAVAFGGTVIHGTLASARKVSIADGAFVTVSNANIEAENAGRNDNLKWAGLTCLGDATITIKGENTIQGFYEDYPGIFVPKYKTLTINGDGVLTARGSVGTSGDRWSAGIGGGYNIPCGSIAVMGGTIYATGGRYAAGIGGGSGGDCGSIRIGAGISRVEATCHASCSTPIGKGGSSSSVANVTVADGLDDDKKSPTRTIVSWWDGNLANVVGDMDVPDGMTLYGTLRESYKLTIEDGAHITLNNANINDMGTLSGSWAALTCAGSAGITLKGVSTVEGFSENYPGIYVPPGNELMIQGDGTLESTGGSSAAGIGAGVNQDCGAILIEDGTIYAHGGSQSAGIGGTSTGNCEFIGIYGGEIEANGGAGGAGVGGGGSGECGPIEIGGAVILYAVGSGIGPSGIGSGTRGACEGVVIYGDADVTATGSSNGAGIGSGLEGSCGYVEISGGNVNATGGQYAAGIGAGRSGTCDDVTIARGITKVQATCGTSGTPISADAVSVRDGLLDDNGTPTRTIMGWNGDLSMLTRDVTVPTGMTIYGTLGEKCKVSIAAGAKVTVSNATIMVDGVNSDSYSWAGLTCLGNAEITLKGESQIRGFYEDYPGIYVPRSSTLTIKGEGELTARSNGWGAGIGGGYTNACGSVSILGGTIIAYGGNSAAGIGGGNNVACEDIYIGGGDVTAYGGQNAAGIGSGYGADASCDSIDIEGKVRVVATRGSGASNAIGAGVGATCYNGPTVSSTLYDDLGAPTRTITVWNGDLSLVNRNITVLSGTKMYGTLGGPYEVTIAAGAKVTVSNATIMVAGGNSSDYKWAGLNCSGGAELTLEGENRICGFYDEYPGIYVPDGATLTIKGGGSLEASSNGWGAGIGGGYEIGCGNIVIDGGVITATGGNRASGIGAGQNASCGDITINDGAIVAAGGDHAPGIGAGMSGVCGDIAITGGQVTATGGYGAAGIGTGDYTSRCGDITITGGSVTATGGFRGAGIGCADNSSRCGKITIGADIVRVVATRGGEGAEPIGKGAGDAASCGTITVANGLPDDNGNPTRTIYQRWDGNLAALTAHVTAQDGTVIYGTLAGNYKVSIAAGATVTLSNAVINGTNSSSYKWAGLTCLGRAEIVLASGSENIVRGFYKDYPGIYVPANPHNSQLTISGKGSLDASSNGYGAGIGGGMLLDSGHIVINGGVITATGGSHSAGIGGGASEECGGVGIYGGTVTATGGDMAAGIGTGSTGGSGYANGGVVIISGGIVTATGGSMGAGIGSGCYANFGNITITGGIVIATGGDDAAGIGCGSVNSSCGNIGIGAKIVRVVATRGGEDAEPIGIGGGDEASCGTVTVDSSLADTTSADENTRTITRGGSVVAAGYPAWAGNNGVSGAWDEVDANGVANVFRYAFDKPTGAFTDPVLLDIAFNEQGKAVILTPPLVNTDGFTFTIEATDNVDGTGNAASYPLDASGETLIDETGKTTRFFRLKAAEQ